MPGTPPDPQLRAAMADAHARRQQAQAANLPTTSRDDPNVKGGKPSRGKPADQRRSAKQRAAEQAAYRARKRQAASSQPRRGQRRG